MVMRLGLLVAGAFLLLGCTPTLSSEDGHYGCAVDGRCPTEAPHCWSLDRRCHAAIESAGADASVDAALASDAGTVDGGGPVVSPTFATCTVDGDCVPGETCSPARLCSRTCTTNESCGRDGHCSESPIAGQPATCRLGCDPEAAAEDCPTAECTATWDMEGYFSYSCEPPRSAWTALGVSCESDVDTVCGPFSCGGWTRTADGVCVVPCDVGFPCSATEACVQPSDGTDRICLVRCHTAGTTDPACGGATCGTRDGALVCLTAPGF